MALRAGDLARRVGGAIGIAAEGIRMAALVLAAGALALALGWHGVGMAAILCGLAIAAFFRDPERSPLAASERLVLSGADGTVSDVAEMPLPDDAAGERYHRVSVFMSPLNVHVNRAPVAGEVTRVEHTAGQFRAAFRDEASQHNERNLIVFRDLGDRPSALMQVAGYLARRIVCNLRVHDRIESGQRIGLIMFGSRVDHFIPTEFAVTVGVGDRVRAGQSILAELNQ